LFRYLKTALSNFDLDEKQLEGHVEQIQTIEATDGMLFSDDYKLYMGGIEKDAVYTLDKDQNYKLLIQDERIQWADSFVKDMDKAIYFTTSQIHLQADQMVKYEICKINL